MRPHGTMSSAAGPLRKASSPTELSHGSHQPNLLHSLSPFRTLRLHNAASDLLAGANITGGMAATIRLGDGAIWADSFGWADRTKKILMRPTEQFRAGSLTKTFTATIVLQLVDEGKISLDEPVAPSLGLAFHKKITARHLLSHTSGLCDYASLTAFSLCLAFSPEQTWTPHHVIRLVMKNDLYFPPGARYEYSNTNYIVLGLLIEAITGHSYVHELTQRILSPLGLHNTVLASAAQQPSLRSVPHYHPDQPWSIHRHRNTPTAEISAAGAAGALVSTTSDIGLFLAELIQGNLISPRAKQEMLQDTPVTDGYGLGIGIAKHAQGLFFGHSGGISTYLSWALHHPASGVTVTVFANDAITPLDGQAQVAFRLFDETFTRLDRFF